MHRPCAIYGIASARPQLTWKLKFQLANCYVVMAHETSNGTFWMHLRAGGGTTKIQGRVCAGDRAGAPQMDQHVVLSLARGTALNLNRNVAPSGAGLQGRAELEGGVGGGFGLGGGGGTIDIATTNTQNPWVGKTLGQNCLT